MEHKGAYGEDKFYLRPTNHVTVHGGAIPIQQPPQVIFKQFPFYYFFTKQKLVNNIGNEFDQVWQQLFCCYYNYKYI